MLSFSLIFYCTDTHIAPAVNLPIFQGYPDGGVSPVMKLPAGPAMPAYAIAIRAIGNLDNPVVYAIAHFVRVLAI